jgi:hypothetical protein
VSMIAMSGVICIYPFKIAVNSTNNFKSTVTTDKKAFSPSQVTRLPESMGGPHDPSISGI